MIKQPPNSFDIVSRKYLSYVINYINEFFTAKDKLTPNYIVPEKPEKGKIYYFPAIINPTITTAGFWGYKESGWVLLG